MQLPVTQIITINEFKGINQSADSSLIDITESPDMLNFELDYERKPKKRKGYKRIIESLGTGNINGHFIYNKKDGTEIELIAHGTKLYKLENNAPTQLYTGLADSRVRFFVMNDICYLMDGAHYLQFDGTTVSEPTAYIPLISMSDSATNNIVKVEDFNLLGPGFRIKRVGLGDGTTKTFNIGVTNLDATLLIVKVDGVSKVEGTDFTVDRVKGEITFTVAPPKNTIEANNIDITAYKTSAANKSCVTKCTLFTVYGGSNDTRVLISGNPDYPNRIYRSGIYDPTYFPDLSYMDTGSNSEKIVNFAKQYDSLVVIKERSLYNVNFTIDNEGVLYTSKPINDSYGCIASESVQLVDNNPVFLTKKGVYMLLSSNIRDEKNVRLISNNVNKSLLEEENLNKAVSVDYNNKYMLFVNSRGYIYDYVQDAWYIWDNINPTSFLEKDSLYFGSNNGIIYRFNLDTDFDIYNDDGAAINAYWYSKLMDLGSTYERKTVSKIYATYKPGIRTSLKLFFRSNSKGSWTNAKKSALFDYNDVSYENFTYLQNDDEDVISRLDLFAFAPFYFAPFSFLSNSFPQTVRLKPKVKKIVYFQLKLENSFKDESLGIDSIDIEFVAAGKVK